MAIYEYSCHADGAFETNAPIGSAPATAPCPACGEAAGRVFSSPMLMRAPRAVVAAIDHAERSAHEPEVVSRLPPSRRRTPVLPLTPTLRRLPRP